MQKFGQIQCGLLRTELRVFVHVTDMGKGRVVMCFYDQDN